MAGELFALVALFWIGGSIWVAIHALNNGKTALWGLVVALFGLLGLIAYAISLSGGGKESLQAHSVVPDRLIGQRMYDPVLERWVHTYVENGEIRLYDEDSEVITTIDPENYDENEFQRSPHDD